MNQNSPFFCCVNHLFPYCDQNNGSKNAGGKQGRWKQANRDVALLNAVRWKQLFSPISALASRKSRQLTTAPAPWLWSRFIKRLYLVLHCAQKLIYRSWPPAPRLCNSHLRKQWQEGSKLERNWICCFPNIFFSLLCCSYTTENFPSLSKIALFLCPTGAIKSCLSIPQPSNRLGLTGHMGTVVLYHMEQQEGVSWEVGGWGVVQRKPWPPGDPVVTHWPPHGGIKA